MQFSGRKGAKLHYRTYGSGPKTLLAFHGYGQDSGFYGVFEKPLQQEYTIYSFDLFYHGKSVLSKAKAPLQKQFLAGLIQDFIAEKNIGQFSLAGFSMGGKFVLAILETMPEKVLQVYLAAPDGISTSFWYNVATYPGFLQKLFKHSVLKPEKFFGLLKFMHRSKIVDQGLVRFADWQMNSLQKRLQVYRSWMGFRTLTFDQGKIIRLINHHKIPVTLFIGKHDKVINGNQLSLFAKKLKTSRVVILNSGHSFLLQEVANYLHSEQKNRK